MSKFNYYKSFILDNIDKDSDVLPLNFYCDLNPGKYIGLRFISLNDSYTFFGKHKSKTGFYEYGMLCYSPSENKFFILLPCFFTLKKMQNIFNSSNLNNEEDIIVLVKKSNRVNVCRPPTAIWEKSVLCQFFNEFTQFHLYEVYCYNDDNAGKVLKTVNRGLKEYLEFIKKESYHTVL